MIGEATCPRRELSLGVQRCCHPDSAPSSGPDAPATARPQETHITWVSVHDLLLRPQRCGFEGFCKHFVSLPLLWGERTCWETVEAVGQRVGRIFLQVRDEPERSTGTESASHSGTSVNQSLLELHRPAADKNDAHVCDFFEIHSLKEHAGESQRRTGWPVTNLREAELAPPALAPGYSSPAALGPAPVPALEPSLAAWTWQMHPERQQYLELSLGRLPGSRGVTLRAHQCGPGLSGLRPPFLYVVRTST